MTAVIDRRDQRGGDDRADARQYSEPAAGGVRAANRDDPCVELFEPAINVVELAHQVGEDLAGEVGQFGLCNCRWRLRFEAPGSLGQDNTIFGEQSARMIDQSGTLANQALARTMQ
jgi:hypothetical protein